MLKLDPETPNFQGVQNSTKPVFPQPNLNRFLPFPSLPSAALPVDPNYRDNVDPNTEAAKTGIQRGRMAIF